MRARVLLLVASLGICPRSASAQVPDTTLRESGAEVSGIVYDSLARRRLADAVVQLVASDSLIHFSRTAVSDSSGGFLFSSVPDGRYIIGFLHAVLDSLGLEAPSREVVIAGHRPVRLDLAVPSPARLRAAICPSRSTSRPATDTGAVVMGIVRDAQARAPAAGATIVVEWLELTFTRNGVIRQLPRLVAATGQNGHFVICGVPRPGTLTLIASRGPDSTDRLEMRVPPDGLLRRDLYVGRARPMVPSERLDPADNARTDTAAAFPPRERAGDEHLAGTVVHAVGSTPVSGAEVRIAGGPGTRANDRGEWSLTGAPAGTRMLEVRALGFYPERLAVDVLPGSRPLRLVLSTLKAVLDTVKVSATRLRDVSGFEARRRGSGVGRYLTQKEISRQHPIVVSDLFRNVPGVRLLGDSIQLRGTFEEWCLAEVYLDGRFLGELGGAEINDWVHPHEVKGIEIYAGPVPPEFSRGMAGTGCGSVVIWTR